MGRPGAGGAAGPCRAMACASACASTLYGKALGGSQAVCCFPLPPRHVYCNMAGFSPPAVAAVPCGRAGFLAPCLCSRSAPFKPDSGPATGRCRCESGPGTTWSPGEAVSQHPGSWRQEAKVSRGVYSLSFAAHCLPGKACAGQLPPAPGVRAVSKQWVESRKRRMGNRIQLRRRRQPRPLGPFPFPAPESPSHSRQPRGRTEGTGMLPPRRAGA